MSNQINHNDLAISRLATQFRESPKLIGYIKALLSEADSLELVLQEVISSRYLDDAIGAQLDTLGAIVGQPRILVDSTLLFYFGFAPNAGAKSFGSVSDPSVGGRFRALGEPTTGNRALTDDEYRLFIRSRIIKNSVTPTIQSMVDFFRFLLNLDQVIVVDGSMSYLVQFGRILSTNERSFIKNINLAPKVAGVHASYQEYDPTRAFGFKGIPSSLGFGSTSNSLIGGKFSTII